MSRAVALTLAVALVVAGPPAVAQETPDPRIESLEKKVEELSRREDARKAADEKAEATGLRAAFEGGKLAWESADAAYRLQLIGRLHFDGVAFVGSANRLANGFVVRRAKIGFQARVAKVWLAQFEADFAGNAVELTDTFLGYDGIVGTIVLAGNFKVPFGMDTLASDNDIWFIERAYVDAWAPGRRLGFGARYGRDRYSFSGSLFGQAISSDTAGVDQGWGWAVRGTYAPVRSSSKRAIHVGLSVTAREPDAAVSGTGPRPTEVRSVILSSRPECTTASRARFLVTPAMNEIAWIRQYGAELAGVWDAFAAQAEYQKTGVTRLTTGLSLPDHTFDGWYAQVSWLLGGSRKYDGAKGLLGRVTPSGRAGALELAARYSTLNLNDFTPIDRIAGGSARNLTFGATWYPNLNVRVMLNWTRVDNDEYARPAPQFGGVPGDDFDEIQFRFQFAF